eukprot:814422-Alexandrium_andersonii.AAC.1
MGSRAWLGPCHNDASAGEGRQCSDGLRGSPLSDLPELSGDPHDVASWVARNVGDAHCSAR